MKKLLITLLLISPASFADWGDSYSCKMTLMQIKEMDGTVTDYLLEKFQFKLDKDKNAMVFDKKGYFDGAEVKVITMMNSEAWYAKHSKGGLVQYDAELPAMGLSGFIYTREGPSITTKMFADCEKF